MIITHIGLENWMAFEGSHMLELPSGPIAVTARYEDNPLRSNWAGKTAFLEAIEWCLFGVHRKRYDDDIIFHGAPSTQVRLRLTGDIEIRRSRKRGNATVLVVEVGGGKDAGGITYIKKEAQTQLEEILGIDNVDYRNTQCFAQGDTEALVDKRSGERRKVVSGWLELDAWLRVAARARANQKSVAEGYRAIKERLTRVEEGLKNLDPEVLARELTVHTATREFTHAEANRTHQTHADAVASLNAQAAVDSLHKAQTEMKLLRTQLTGVGSPEDSLGQAREDLSALASNTWGLSREVTEANAILEGGFDGECPVTCSECPVPDKVANAREAIQIRAKDADKKHQEAKELRDAADEKVSGLDEELADITRKRERFKALGDETKRLKVLAKASVQGVTQEMVDVADQARRDAQEVAAEAGARMRMAEQDIKHRAELVMEAGTLEEELSAQEDQLRLATVAVKCVGPTGVPGQIAEEALGDLEDRSNELLADSGLAFTFAWDRETATLAPSCPECGYLFKGTKDKSCPACEAHRGWKRADELEILVDDGAGPPEEVKTKSGGAKVLVASAIRLAAGVMLRDLRGSSCAWAQVDEPFGPLDQENRAHLARTFAGMLSAVGLEQAFVVSHDSALLDALPHRIEVIRKGDRSVVSLVA